MDRAPNAKADRYVGPGYYALRFNDGPVVFWIEEDPGRSVPGHRWFRAAERQGAEEAYGFSEEALASLLIGTATVCE